MTKEVSATKRNVLSCKSGYSPDHPGVNRKYSGAGANCETDALLVTMHYAVSEAEQHITTSIKLDKPDLTLWFRMQISYGI